MDDSHLILVAASLGESETVANLIKAGHDINEVDRNLRTPVRAAVENGHLDVVKLLVEATCEVGKSLAIKRFKRYPRTSQNTIKRVLPSLDHKVDVVENEDSSNSQSSSTSSRLEGADSANEYVLVPTTERKSIFPPLNAAVTEQHTDIVRFLLGCDRVEVNLMYLKETPLIIASKLNDQSLVKLLIEADANINFDKNALVEVGVTAPIHHAVVNGNYEMVKYFIDHGAKYIGELPLNVRSYRIPGAIALRYYGSLIELACQNNMPDILTLLIDSFESEITFLCKHYALVWCCEMDCKECLDILLFRLYSTECELNNAHLAQNHQQVLRIALRRNSAKDEIIPLRLLEHFGPKMFTDPTSYFITLHIGVLRVFPKFVKAMIEFQHMFPKTDDEESIQDICYSALNGVNLSILKDLNDTGMIDVKYIDHMGENAAFNVVQSSKTKDIDELVTWLSELGVSFTKRNNRGMEPIHTAVGARTGKTIEVLTRHGVDIDSRTSENQTPLHLALNTGWELERSLVQTLLDNGADLGVRDNLERTPITVFVLSYFSTFHTGQAWCLEAPNGWRWALDLFIEKLGCCLYNVHVVGHVIDKDWQTLVDVMSESQRASLCQFPKLQTLCWGRIRSSIGGVHFLEKVDRLPLPRPLRNFLKTF